MNFKRLNYTEPAVLRGIVAAVVALLGAVGVTVGTDLSALADACIVVVSLAVPIVQAVTTRAAVVSPATADREVEQAQALAAGDLPVTKHHVTPQTPGKADHAAGDQ